MADEDEQIEDIGDNDEYQFADLDGLGTEPVDSPSDSEAIETEEAGVSSPPNRGRLDPQMMKTIKKGVFAVGGLLLFLLIYKFVTSFFASPKAEVKKRTPVAVTAPKVEPKSRAQIQPKLKSPLPLQVSNTTLDNNSTNKKLDALVQERTRLNADLLSMHKQVRDVTQAVSAMTSSIDDLKQSMESMNEKIEQQSQQVTRLKSVKRTKVSASAPVSRAAKTPRTRYFVQAIIPGRAWLMSSQGKTLTVSRGSAVPGYGDVRLINSKLGRVFTSSGRVIQFSQADT